MFASIIQWTGADNVPPFKNYFEKFLILGIYPLEAMHRRLEADFMKTGLPVYRSELRPGAKPGYVVNCVPKAGAPRLKIELREIPDEPCPACGTLLEFDGRCRACWGDVLGLCEECGGILDEGFVCPTHGPMQMD